jgi:hypothetical protein
VFTPALTFPARYGTPRRAGNSYVFFLTDQELLTSMDVNPSIQWIKKGCLLAMQQIITER